MADTERPDIYADGGMPGRRCGNCRFSTDRKAAMRDPVSGGVRIADVCDCSHAGRSHASMPWSSCGAWEARA